MSPSDASEALIREALRLHERYHRELIERFSVCPWAKAARVEGRTRTHVVAIVFLHTHLHTYTPAARNICACRVSKGPM